MFSSENSAEFPDKKTGEASQKESLPVFFVLLLPEIYQKFTFYLTNLDKMLYAKAESFHRGMRTMTSLDIICIGAINYDYMFHCTAEDLRINEIESGDEKLSNPISEVEDDISELIHKDRPYTTQIGGSAFITLKVIKHILPQLKAAYVGVCGTPNDFDFRYGKSNNLAEEHSHLDDKQWLFTTEDRFEDPYSRTIAKSVVRLYNHTRNCIKIAPCANNTLLGRIQEKEERTGESFSEYLSQARWIHLSSLSDFEQFEVIMRYVIQAKMLNPALRVSMDPGFEYTSRRRERLQSLVSNSDYIFLNKAEKRNLGLNAERMRPLYRNLCEYFTEINPSPERTLIVKHDDRHELLRFHENKCRIRTIRHQKLYQYQLNNDTGAGDSFAGGFISGMLDDRINSDIAGPIQLGVLAAKGRMRSFDHENPYQNIQKLTDAFFASL